MRDYSFTLAAGASAFKPIQGTFIKVNTAGADLRVIAESAAGDVVADIAMKTGTWVKLTTPFKTLRVKNEGAALITASITVGTGEVDDSTLNGNVTVSGVLDATSRGSTIAAQAVTVGTVAALLLATSTARRSIVIQNNSTNDIYIGAAGVTVLTGLKIAAGQSMIIDRSAQAEVFAVSSVAGNDIRLLQELD